jgi:hypothetical protein
MNSQQNNTPGPESQGPEKSEKKGLNMQCSAAFAKALLAVQKTCLVASKDGTNTFFQGRKYATLDEIINTVREPLTNNGLVLMQDTDCDGTSVKVITRLIHESGEAMESAPLVYTLQPEFTGGKQGAPVVQVPAGVQQIGKAITYLRRYSLSPFLGIACEVDDDGNTASHADTTPAPKGQPVKTASGVTVGHVAEGSVRKSAYTGELLDNPAAIERHQVAASAAKAKADAAFVKAVIEPAAGKPSGIASDAQVRGAFNAALYDACEASGVTTEELDAYLRGQAGNPRIKTPVLGDGMTIHNMGERIVDALLKEKDKPESNWNKTVARIVAGRK